MKKYLICNWGCDDKTETEMELTDMELQTLINFAKENNKNSSYQCQPKIGIFKKYKVEKGEYTDEIYYDYDNIDDLVKEEK